MARVIIFGVGQIAEIAHFYLTNDSEHEVVAFTVDREFLSFKKFHNLPVVAYEELLREYPPGDFKLFIAISYQKINKTRAEKFYDAKAKGYECVSYISSKATYYNTPVGENCLILENNVIQPYTKIGDNCILWSGNHIGHHSVIYDHCFIASQVVISGNVDIGSYSFLGVNSTIANNVDIGASNVIGAGAIIFKSTEDCSVYSPLETTKSRVPSNRLRGL
ncbi:acetyltransferase [Francisella philomiragia]|uniref:acetyltransferase n=1 Tax=Francisella philomiragia TaxID=28110 RepID=UPI0019049EEB|nr:acetyltransferase [Francisella philomiragia]MBK2267744.1 acetyltransferase [Francisella philomiragia]MBK2279158.1 acetyltransferase [Francisella philomiragia]MBK2287053.1 acetyltransferase [Francisella philomiragia]MBK2288990.1 acetyltransferase [Francisella philomiragia]MBK2290708.1 acetyltransferase [Francisella philomiragia]